MTMPREKDLKRLVRARMAKTGEAYTAARAQILRKSTPPSKAPSPDYAALAGMADEAVNEKTGRTWEQWVRTLDRHDAATMAHREIAMLVSVTYKVPEWWSQTVTVGYERIKGLRVRGQHRDGTYDASKSRTYAVPVATLFDAWADTALRNRWLDGTTVKVRSATAPKAMRLLWPDGSVVIAGFTAKGDAKSSVALAHTRLPDRETATRLKQYWSERFDALGDVLARR
jgi:hypothetical protein